MCSKITPKITPVKIQTKKFIFFQLPTSRANDNTLLKFICPWLRKACHISLNGGMIVAIVETNYNNVLTFLTKNVR